MAAITQAKDVKRQEWNVGHLPLAATTKIYEGALVMANASGLAVNGADTASCKFVGVATKTVDNNTTALATEAATEAEFWTYGVIDVVFSGTATQADVGKQVYLVDNQTVALAATTTNDVLVGRIVEFISANKVRIALTPLV